MMASTATAMAVLITTDVLGLALPRLSMIRLNSRGVRTTTTEDTTTVARKSAMSSRYGRANATMRRAVPGVSRRLTSPSRVNDR